MTRVLIVEDSPVAREFLSYIFSSDPDIEVVGIAENGIDAIEAARTLRPSVITMDIHMPLMDGFEATRRIMETAPTPIVIVSGSTVRAEVASTFRALEAGALAIVPRPPAIDEPAFETNVQELILTVKLMSEVKVVRRYLRPERTEPCAPTIPVEELVRTEGIKAIAIGASTGGPPALRVILAGLAGLAGGLPVPMFIVQHIAPGFVGGFAEWLAGVSGIPVHVAVDGGIPIPGHAYLAPDGFHLGVSRESHIALSDDPPDKSGIRPSVARLFRSVAEAFGAQVIAVLLTGMGCDGASELKALKDLGAVTIAQDEESSIVNGMPGGARKLGAAMYSLPPESIPTAILAVLEKEKEEIP